jgi:hypothetical protein
LVLLAVACAAAIRCCIGGPDEEALELPAPLLLLLLLPLLPLPLLLLLLPLLLLLLLTSLLLPPPPHALTAAATSALRTRTEGIPRSFMTWDRTDPGSQEGATGVTDCYGRRRIDALVTVRNNLTLRFGVRTRRSL